MPRRLYAPAHKAGQSAGPGSDGPDLAQLAGLLAEAARTRTPVPLLSARFPDLTLADAYRIQRIGVERRVAAGGHVAGYKVGLTSLAMQQQMGLYEPDSGAVLEDMVEHSGCQLDAAAFMSARIETEIAVRLGSDLPPDAGLGMVRAAVSEVFLAFEILDICFTGWGGLTLVDSIADNAACARVVLGTPAAFDPGWDLAAERIVTTANGEATATGWGSDVLGNPLNALVWLAHRLPAIGTTLRAGDIVLAGSVHASLPLTTSTQFRATSTRLPTLDLRIV